MPVIWLLCKIVGLGIDSNKNQFLDSEALGIDSKKNQFLDSEALGIKSRF